MNRLLQDAITARAEARPESVAVVSGQEHLNYGQLEEASNRLAQLLVDAGCEEGDRIGLFMAKGLTAITAILAALKSGAAYVPLDPTDPPARLARTLASADCRWMLAAGNVGNALREAIDLADLKQPPLIGWLDDTPPDNAPKFVFSSGDLERFPSTPPSTRANGRKLAQILFTSGSTGMPKGVMLQHSAIISYIDWATAYFGIAADDRISQHSPLRFDLSTFDIFGALSAGAELHLVPPELNILPHKLAQFIRDRRLTQWLSVPSTLNLMAKYDVIDTNDFPELRRVLFLGEVLPTPTLIHWMRRLPHASFTNLYGPTETTIASSYYAIPEIPTDALQALPIGRACTGEELLVLDAELRPMPIGETGDLYIRGAGLAVGYLNDTEKTTAAFLKNPNGDGPEDRIYKTGDRARLDADGLFHFCGRADTQIKCRGYRIELGDIEAALHVVPALKEGAVLAIESPGFEGMLICCAYAPKSDSELSQRQLRVQLAELLPGYMLPMRWLRLEALPKNVTGKIDRAGLAEAFRKAEIETDDQPIASAGSQ